MRHLCLTFAQALFAVAAAMPTGQLRADNHQAMELRPLNEMPLDFTLFDAPLDVQYAYINILELIPSNGDLLPQYHLEWIRSQPGQFDDLPYGSAAYLERVREFCDTFYSGTCELSAQGEAPDIQVNMRVVRDLDGIITIQNERLIGNIIVSVTAFLSADAEEEVGQRNVAELLQQTLAYAVP